MNDQVKIALIRFAEDFSSGIKPSGEELHFTRYEARALRYFAQNPGRLVSREQLLNALSDEGSDKNDRNVDFLVNRIRRKLNDSVKDPYFIATRYGEGYVWVAPPNSPVIAHSDAYLVIGPVRQAGLSDNMSDLVPEFCQELATAFTARLPAEDKAAFDPHCPPSVEFGARMPEIGVEMTFFSEAGALECIAKVKRFGEGKIIAIKRIFVFGGTGGNAADLAPSTKLADWILHEIWRERASIHYRGDPLPVALQIASKPEKQTPGIKTWKINDPLMRKLISDNPDDPDIKIKYATHLHTKYVVAGHELFQKGIDERSRDESKIEQLVLEAMPFIQSNPGQVIMAAKLLHFLSPGYDGLAIDLAEQAHRQSTVITHTLPIIGQMRGHMGDIDSGVEALDKAIELSERGSHAHLYALVIKCNLCMAKGDADDLNSAKRELYSNRPAVAFFFDPYYTDPISPSLRARAAIMMLSRAAFAAKLMHSYYVSARLFRRKEHRENAIRTPLALIIRRFNSDAVPDEIASAFPELMQKSSQPGLCNG